MSGLARAALTLFVVVLAGAAACSLNPQPLPPYTGGGDNAVGSASADSGALHDGASSSEDANPLSADGGDGGDDGARGPFEDAGEDDARVDADNASREDGGDGG